MTGGKSVRHKQKKAMKGIEITLALMISIVHISYGQNESNVFEKQITIIEYFGNDADTTFQNMLCDLNGNQFEVKSKYLSYPIKVDTTYVSDTEMVIEETWEDNSQTIFKEINSPRNLINLLIDRNGFDTIYFSEFKLSKNGLPLERVVVNYGDTTKFEINEKFLIEELYEIQKTLIKDSEFIDFNGIIQFPSRKKIKITEFEEPRNTVEIILNRRLKPKKIIKREWHEYHKTIFVNKYSYTYQDDNLVEIKNVDMYGDLEMIRTINYKFK